MAGGVSRRVTGGHPGGSAGRARRRLWFHLDGLSAAADAAAAWEGSGLPRAFTEGLTHAACVGALFYADLSPDRWSGSSISAAFFSKITPRSCLVKMCYIFRDTHRNPKTPRPTVTSQLEYPHHLSQQSYVQALLMDTDTSAGLSPPLSGKLCLHSAEPCLNMARPEL